jgi:hypothetical protein
MPMFSFFSKIAGLFEQATVDRFAEVTDFEHREPRRKANRKGRKDDVKRDREGELHPGQ